MQRNLSAFLYTLGSLFSSFAKSACASGVNSILYIISTPSEHICNTLSWHQTYATTLSEVFFALLYLCQELLFCHERGVLLFFYQTSNILS